MHPNDIVGNMLVDLTQTRFVTPYCAEVVSLALADEHLHARTGGVRTADLLGFSAVVEHRRRDAAGRADVYFVNPERKYTSIGGFWTGPYRFRVNPHSGHAVVRHGVIVENWLTFDAGRFRLPVSADAIARKLLYRRLHVTSYDTYAKREYGLRLAGLGIAAAAAAFTGGAAPATVSGRISQGLAAALGGRALGFPTGGRSAVKDELSAHIADLVGFVAERLHEQDESILEDRLTGRTAIALPRSGHADLPSGYFAMYRIESAGTMTVSYSGDGNASFGNHQGTIRVKDYRIDEWWYLGPKKKRLRIA